MAKEVKGITWVGNIYQKFENTCLEVEDMIFEDTVKYIENQMQTVGENVKKFYSDVMQDLLPPSSCDMDENVTSELPTNQYTDDGCCKKSLKGSKERFVMADSKQTIEDSRITCDVNNDVICAASKDGSCETAALFMSASGNSVKVKGFISHASDSVRSTDIKSNLGIVQNQQNKNITATKTFSEITLPEIVTCSTSQPCEFSGEYLNNALTVSKPASAEVTRLASVVDCFDEIENASTEQIPNILVLFTSADEKEENMCVSSSSSSSTLAIGDPNRFSEDKIKHSDDCSYNRVFVSHPEIPETWSLDAMKIDTVIKEGHNIMQQDDDELKLEETCVVVSRDELQLVPKALGNIKTKEKMRRAFSLSKKSARKQEYEELAVWHGSHKQAKCPNLLKDQKKLLLPNISELDWELL